MKTAIYVRCSTKTKGQDVENQLIQLRTFCKRSNYEITKVYEDYESGNDLNRKGFNEMLNDARKRKFELLVFWSLDRFSRSGTRQTIHYLQQLESYNVVYKSFTEQYIDSAGIFSDVIISILSTLAKQEKVRLSERVKAGLDKARTKGRVGGRPKLNQDVIEKIKEMKSQGYSNRHIGRELKIGNSTVGQYL